MKHEKATIVSDTNFYSGSIQELKYVSSSLPPVIEVVEFGTYVDGGENIIHQRYAADITLTPNETLEGPISGFSLTQGAVLVKHNRELDS
tara:strand:+ start:846 stop:1115 length:270 start_codon:yes stop_codon:yes gene_type:complete